MGTYWAYSGDMVGLYWGYLRIRAYYSSNRIGLKQLNNYLIILSIFIFSITFLNSPCLSHIMRISLIVAASTNNAIGKDNQLLWRLPNDLRFFKNTTWAMPVIMGRHTFESMGNKALPGRMNMVITRNQDWKAEGVIVVHSLVDAVAIAKSHQYKEVFVAGGGGIYRESLAYADRIFMTRVHANLEGDTFFPEIDQMEWQLVSNEDWNADAKHAYPYSFQLWQRK